MNSVPEPGRGPNKNAQPVIENHLAATGPGAVTVPEVAEATGLPVGLVSTILGRMARYGTELTRTGHQRAGTFYYQPSRRRTVRALPSMASPPPPAPMPAPQPRRTAHCPDTLMEVPEDAKRTSGGYWVAYGASGRPYRVEEL